MSKPNLEKFDSRYNRLRLKAASLAGLAALAGVPITASKADIASANSYGIGLVGFSDNDLFNDDQDQAEAVASKIEAMGGTAARIFYPLNKDTAWENYANRTCNAARAAYDHHLQLIISFVGYNALGRGYVPSTPTEITQATTTAGSLLWTMGSKKDANHPGGCAPQQKNFIFEGINEINNDTFNQTLNEETPAQAAQLDYRLAKRLKKEAARPEIGGTVSYGESLAAGNHDPLQFISQEGAAAKKLGLKIKYDFIDIHPYPADPTADPSLTMQSLYQSAKDTIATAFPGAKLVWGEVGVNTINPPAAEAGSYTPPVSTSLGVSETSQAKYINNILKTAASEGTPWVTLFDVQDDGGKTMPSSGLFYISGKPKSSQPAVRYQIGKYTNR
jgi:hypothetical protein